MHLAQGGDAADLTQTFAAAVPQEPTIGDGKDDSASSASGYMAPWIDTEQCTSCDECTKLNSSIFQYNENKKAFIKDPFGGPYKDLVKAAELCTARVIHPGLPKDRNEKGIAKWIARAEKFN